MRHPGFLVPSPLDCIQVESAPVTSAIIYIPLVLLMLPFYSLPLLRSLMLLSILLTIPLFTRGQGYAEGISLSYELLPLKLTNYGEHTFRADVYRASLIVQAFPSADSARTLLTGISLEALHFDGERPGFAVRNVYGLTPIIGYRWRTSPRLELTALALPGLNSDLRVVVAEDITWGGIVRAVYRATPQLAYRLTMGYRQQFYGPQYVLLLGLDWHPAARWRVFGDLPTSLTLSYALTQQVNVGFNLTGINTAYRLLPDNQYFQYQQGHYGLFAEYYLSSHWALRFTTAYSVTRRLDAYSRYDQWTSTIDYIGLGKAPTALNPTIDKGVAFRVALSYRVLNK